MSDLLKGEVAGESHADLTKQALIIAAGYFDTQCVGVRLYQQEFAHDGTFTSRFEARVEHYVEAKAYGPNTCRKCKAESWPHRPIPRAADWSSDDR